MIGTDEANRITIEEGLGKPPAKLDTPEQAIFRKDIRKEIKKILADGYEVQLPNE